MTSSSYLLCSLDVGGTVDPAAIAVAHVSKLDRLTKTRVLHLAVKPPILSPGAHIDLVQQTMATVLAKVGYRAPVRYIVDISNNSAIGYLLAQVLPRNSLIGAKVTGGESHAAGLQPLLVGDVGGRATSIPVMNLSRRQLLLDIGVAFQSGQLTLPREDPEQTKALHILKEQMARASLKVTASGKQVAVVQRSHDDLLMSLAQLWAATKLPTPRDFTGPKQTTRPATSAGGWT